MYARGRTLCKHKPSRRDCWAPTSLIPVPGSAATLHALRAGHRTTCMLARLAGAGLHDSALRLGHFINSEWICTTLYRNGSTQPSPVRRQLEMPLHSTTKTLHQYQMAPANASRHAGSHTTRERTASPRRHSMSPEHPTAPCKHATHALSASSIHAPRPNLFG